MRDYILNILFKVYQYRPDLKARIGDELEHHCENLREAIASNPDRVDQIQAEIDHTCEVLEAPNKEMVKNFPKISPEPFETAIDEEQLKAHSTQIE